MNPIDLFGREIFDPLTGGQMPLFHEPVPAPPVKLPGTTAADAKIGRKFARTRTLPLLTPEIARAAGTDAGNASMRAAGRATWNREDYNACARETNRLLDKCPDDPTTAAHLAAASFRQEHPAETVERLFARYEFDKLVRGKLVNAVCKLARLDWQDAQTWAALIRQKDEGRCPDVRPADNCGPEAIREYLRKIG